MSVREYIGARYVPIFSDPIQWDNTKTYEPLTVVKNQGTSYVSKQSVPEGIDILNESYWLRWADYNAQLEEYIRQVNSFSGRIEALEEFEGEITGSLEEFEGEVNTSLENINEKIDIKTYAFDTVSEMQDCSLLKNNDVCFTLGFHSIADGGNAVYIIKDTGTSNGYDILEISENNLYAHLIDTENVCSYGADKSGTLDSFNALMFYASKHNSITLQPGVYNISAPLDFTNTTCSKVYGNGATIKAAGAMNFMLKASQRQSGDDFSIIKDLKIDGNNVAVNGIVTTQQMRLNGIESCKIVNTHITNEYNSEFVPSAGQNLFIDNVFLINDPTTIVNATGLHISADCHISNSKFWGLKTAIKSSGSYNFISNCNFWHFNAPFERIGIKRDDANIHTPIFVDNCYFDGMNIAVSGYSPIMSNCLFLYSDTESNTYDNCVLDPANNFKWLSKNSSYHSPKFTNCVFNSIDEGNSDKYKYLMPISPAIKLENCNSNISYYLNPVRNLINNPNAPNSFKSFKVSNSGWYEYMRLVHPSSNAFSIAFNMIQNSNYSSIWKVIVNDGPYYKIQKLYGESGFPAYAVNHNLAVIPATEDGENVLKFLIFLEPSSTETTWNFENVSDINNDSGLFIFQSAIATGYTTQQIQAIGKQIELIS